MNVASNVLSEAIGPACGRRPPARDVRRHAGGIPSDRAGGTYRSQRPVDGRERLGKGACGAIDPRSQPAARRPLRRDQLRRHSGGPHRGRAVRLSRRAVLPARCARTPECSSERKAERCLLDEVTEMPLDMQTRLAAGAGNAQVLSGGGESRNLYRCARDRRDQSLPAAGRAERPIARGLAVPFGGLSDRHAAAAQPGQRCGFARRALSRRS